MLRGYLRRPSTGASIGSAVCARSLQPRQAATLLAVELLGAGGVLVAGLAAVVARMGHASVGGRAVAYPGQVGFGLPRAKLALAALVLAARRRHAPRALLRIVQVPERAVLGERHVHPAAVLASDLAAA